MCKFISTQSFFFSQKSVHVCGLDEYFSLFVVVPALKANDVREWEIWSEWVCAYHPTCVMCLQIMNLNGHILIILKIIKIKKSRAGCSSSINHSLSPYCTAFYLINIKNSFPIFLTTSWHSSWILKILHTWMSNEK